MKNSFDQIQGLSLENNSKIKFQKNFLKLISTKDIVNILKDIDPFYSTKEALLARGYLQQEKDLYDYLVDSPDISKDKAIDIVRSCMEKYESRNEIRNWSKAPVRRLIQDTKGFAL